VKDSADLEAARAAATQAQVRLDAVRAEAADVLKKLDAEER
jgi:hypothetical protein